MTNTNKLILQLRFFQFSFIMAVILSAYIVVLIPNHKTQGAMTVGQWIVLLFALYSSVIWFFVPRLIARAKMRNTGSLSGSPQIQRWFTGYLLRLATAECVCFSGLALYVIGGVNWQVYALVGGGLLGLFILQPGEVPTENESQNPIR